jgi:hypothetical protein
MVCVSFGLSTTYSGRFIKKPKKLVPRTGYFFVIAQNFAQTRILLRVYETKAYCPETLSLFAT